MGESMGMTDKQFNSYVRFLLEDIKEAYEELELEKAKKKLQKIIDNLQATIED